MAYLGAPAKLCAHLLNKTCRIVLHSSSVRNRVRRLDHGGSASRHAPGEHYGTVQRTRKPWNPGLRAPIHR